MKYVRKFIAMLVGIIIFAAVVISIGMIYAVKNINVTLITYADEYEDDYADAKSSLSVFKGESIIFVSEEDVAKVIKSSNYTLASFEKIFPCTINVTLKERLETLALAIDGGYSLYDSDGVFLRKSSENINIDDYSPNVEVLGVTPDEMQEVASIAAVFKDKFGSLRSIVTSINIDKNSEIQGYTDKLYFNMRCGLRILIDDYTQSTEEKIQCVYDKFCTLSDRQKLSGVLRGYRLGGDDGIVNADYSSL